MTRPEMYEAGTGAVRSSDLKEERWDLLSGDAFRMLRDAMCRTSLAGESIADLVDEAIDLTYRFLGDVPGAGGSRLENLLNGWSHLALAMELEEGAISINKVRYPAVAMHRTARTAHEGAVKYGEDNWLHGFRVKILCNHLLRHLIRYSNGIIEDDELGHASWGFMAAVHMYTHRPDMCDLLLGPNYTITPESAEYYKNHASRSKS